jgi:hypothetical protein
MKALFMRRMPGSWGFLMAIAVCLAVAGWGPDPAQATTTYTIAPSDDAYVYNLSPTSNYGTQTFLQIQDVASGVVMMYTYLKFPLADIPDDFTITQARMYLYMYTHNPSTGSELHETGNTWTQTTINWNNKPAVGDLLDTAALTTNGWVYWTVPNADIVLTEDYLYLMLKATGTPSPLAQFWSTEYSVADNHPYLEIQGVPVPLPGAVWLLGTALLGLGLGGYTRRRRP